MKSILKADHAAEVWSILPRLEWCQHMRSGLRGIRFGWLRWQWTFAWLPSAPEADKEET